MCRFVGVRAVCVLATQKLPIGSSQSLSQNPCCGAELIVAARFAWGIRGRKGRLLGRQVLAAR
jgi:hypothetical protein